MKKPRLSFWQIWNMSFGFLGIQFGFALQNGNVSRIFQTLGAEIDQIPILWIATPVTGLRVQPIIGHMSDNTWGRLGRRRPYFLVGAIMASIALILMPNSPGLWIAVGMLWIMDASINISMEPFCAFVGDMMPDEQRTLGFTMQSFFIGIGAFVASLVSGMFGWYNLFAAVFGLFMLPLLARLTSRKITHSIALVISGVGLASIMVLGRPEHMIFSMIGIGLAWASILAMPYAILTGSLPAHKMGVYMGIFNFFIVIPQILAATILGFMVRALFDGNSIYALLMGGISLFLAAVLVLFIKDVLLR